MENFRINDVIYRYKEQFDVNLTLQYENDRWGAWHVVREFISNALDSVGGDVARVSIIEQEGYIHICDHGQGYPITFAKRIGASSKKQDDSSIGQFGEGIKMAVLTCLRKGLSVMLASQNWLIIPKAAPIEEGLQVLVFDIYESAECIAGSLVRVQASEEIRQIVSDLDQFFLQFAEMSPVFGTMAAGIYSKGDTARVFNKGVYIKDIDSLYSYGLAINQLNRDRDLVEDNALCLMIRDLWNTVDNPQLIQSYFEESNRMAQAGENSKFKEFTYCIYPSWECRDIWVKTFYNVFGARAIISTNDLASREAKYLGFIPIPLDYCGRNLAEFIGIEKDTDVVSDDYEFVWAVSLNEREEKRLSFFRQVVNLIGMEWPGDVKVFDSYAKGENVIGLYNPDKDEVYLSRKRLNGNIEDALETFIHELTHRATGADDLDRRFANSLSTLSSKLLLELIKTVGLPVTLKLTNRGFKLPKEFSYSAENLHSHIATIGSSVVITTNGHVLTSTLPGKKLRPYCSERPVTFYKGSFYVNIPASIRQVLPGEMVFSVTINVDQI